MSLRCRRRRCCRCLRLHFADDDHLAVQLPADIVLLLQLGPAEPRRRLEIAHVLEPQVRPPKALERVHAQVVHRVLEQLDLVPVGAAPAVDPRRTTTNQPPQRHPVIVCERAQRRVDGAVAQLVEAA